MSRNDNVVDDVFHTLGLSLLVMILLFGSENRRRLNEEEEDHRSLISSSPLLLVVVVSSICNSIQVRTYVVVRILEMTDASSSGTKWFG